MPDDTRRPKPTAEEINMRQTLLSAAEIVVRAKVHPAPLSEDQAARFAAAVDVGRIIISDDQISFSTVELRATWIARYYALNISDVWEDLTEATKALQEGVRLSIALRLPRSFTVQLLISLENDCGRNVLARLVDAARVTMSKHEAEVPPKAIYIAFSDALPQLDYQPSYLADQLGPVMSATANYMPEGMWHEAIERLAEQSQEKAEALVRAFLQRPELPSSVLAASALKALWTFDPGRAHRQATELTKETLPSIQCIGARALAWFNYKSPSHDRELTATIDRLEMLCASNDPDLLSVIAQAFGVLFAVLDDSNKTRRITEGILRLASHGDPAVQSVVARVLVQRTDDSVDADWFWDALGRLSGVPAENKDTLFWLDHAAYGRVERFPDRVVRHLEGVVTSRPYGMEGEKDRLPDLYKDTVILLIEKQQPILETTLTRWFASRDARLHAAAADIVACFVKEARLYPNRAVRLDSSELNALEEGDVQRVIFALMGWVDDFKALASLLVSVLLRMYVSDRVRELIVAALVNVALYNMPGSVGDYLRSVAQHTDTPELVRQVVKDSFTRSDAYHSLLKDRPKLKELSPPDIRVHRYRAVYNQLIQSTRENMLNESGFLSMIPITPVKYGRASFSAEDGNAASSVQMKTIRTEIEWPRGSIIDPLGRVIGRMEWRQFAVDGLPVESPSDAVTDSCGSNDKKEAEQA